MGNARIAEILEEIADMIEAYGEGGAFEVKAYRKAAQEIESLQDDIAEIYSEDGLEGLMKIPGVGKGIAGKIEEYLKTGKVRKHESMKKKHPIDFASLTKIQGIGAKTSARLYDALGIAGLAELKEAVANHKIRELEGFGQESEERMRKGIEIFESGSGRVLLSVGLLEAEALLRQLASSGFAERAEVAGSARRMRETLGDIDILVASEHPDKVMEFAGKMHGVSEVMLKGPTKTTLRLGSGINCDIRVVDPGCFGAAMQYFTGSKEHNVAVRQIAARKGYKLNEYGLFDRNEKMLAGRDEKGIYARLGMDYTEPEMREDRGEVELALKHGIYPLVEIGDIRGDLHVHSKFSDGDSSIDEMAGEAARIGLEYIGFTDHSKAERVANGMDEAKFTRYSMEIDNARKKYSGAIEILKSAETDILKDGSLDFSRKALEEMDYVMAAVHTSITMPRKEMTRRIVKCIESNMVDLLAHPTDRIIGRRQQIDADWEEIFDSAKKHGVAMEIDSFPERLDLGDEKVAQARQMGLQFSVDTDSHSRGHFRFLRYGVGTARRGWLPKEEVINTLSFKSLSERFG